MEHAWRCGLLYRLCSSHHPYSRHFAFIFVFCGKKQHLLHLYVNGPCQQIRVWGRWWFEGGDCTLMEVGNAQQLPFWKLELVTLRKPASGDGCCPSCWCKQRPSCCHELLSVLGDTVMWHLCRTDWRWIKRQNISGGPVCKCVHTAQSSNVLIIFNYPHHTCNILFWRKNICSY